MPAQNDKPPWSCPLTTARLISHVTLFPTWSITRETNLYPLNSKLIICFAGPPPLPRMLVKFAVIVLSGHKLSCSVLLGTTKTFAKAHYTKQSVMMQNKFWGGELPIMHCVLKHV